jgi:hypothetical protein
LAILKDIMLLFTVSFKCGNYYFSIASKGKLGFYERQKYNLHIGIEEQVPLDK